LVLVLVVWLSIGVVLNVKVIERSIVLAVLLAGVAGDVHG